VTVDKESRIIPLSGPKRYAMGLKELIRQQDIGVRPVVAVAGLALHDESTVSKKFNRPTPDRLPI
jgi:hypothetical protein